MLQAHQRKKVRGASPPDPDEEAALSCAIFAVAQARGRSSEEIATACIMAWTQERAKRIAASRLSSYLAFDLHEANTRGAVEAALPAIADELTWLDPKAPFFELPKEEVIDLVIIASTYAGQAWVVVNEEAGSGT